MDPNERLNRRELGKRFLKAGAVALGLGTTAIVNGIAMGVGEHSEQEDVAQESNANAISGEPITVTVPQESSDGNGAKITGLILGGVTVNLIGTLLIEQGAAAYLEGGQPPESPSGGTPVPIRSEIIYSAA